MMHLVANETCDTQNLNMIKNDRVGVSQKVSKYVDYKNLGNAAGDSHDFRSTELSVNTSTYQYEPMKNLLLG